jgi:hypothetical protein
MHRENSGAGPRPASLFFFALIAFPLAAQDNQKIWNGVYTAAQAARGKTAF